MAEESLRRVIRVEDQALPVQRDSPGRLEELAIASPSPRRRSPRGDPRPGDGLGLGREAPRERSGSRRGGRAPTRGRPSLFRPFVIAARTRFQSQRSPNRIALDPWLLVFLEPSTGILARRRNARSSSQKYGEEKDKSSKNRMG
jgi:hypothetical protein